MQVAAHALLLREHGVNAVRGAIYYAADKRRVPVEFSEELFEKVKKAIADAKRVASSGSCPPPLKNDARCLYCSAYPICLPNESLWWAKRRKPVETDAQMQFGFVAQSEDAVRDQILAALDFAAECRGSTGDPPVSSGDPPDETGEGESSRRVAATDGPAARATPPTMLQPPRPDGDDGEVLVVQTAGAQIGQRGDELIVSIKGEDACKIPGQQVRAIYCYGAV
jgi:CRISPR-associated protein Cas1